MNNTENLILYAYAMVEALDHEIGRLLDNIHPDTLKKTTIIFLGTKNQLIIKKTKNR